VLPAGYDAPMDAAKRPVDADSAGMPDGRGKDDRKLMPIPPDGVNLAPPRPLTIPPNDLQAARIGQATDRSDDAATSSSATASEPFLGIQKRLQQLGATYYVLETMGDQGRTYRFMCKMAVAGNPKYTRPFWAVDNDPLSAMNSVLEQVELWRSGKM
jgi:hypothetical protein